MMKKNQTFEIIKIYEDRKTWTDTIVGKSTLNKYLRKLNNVIASEKGKVVCYTVLSVGKIEENIEKREEINIGAFKNIRLHDTKDDNDNDEEEEAR